MAPSFEEPVSQHRTVSSTVDAPLTYTAFEPHPTHSLQFLKSNSVEKASSAKPLLAKVKLNIIIVGAGLGGLGCAIALARRGHQITVLEQASEIGEVGAGIQIPSNSSRLLLSWGLGPLLAPYVVEPSGISFRRWSNGDTIGYTKLIPDFQQNFEAPYYVIHRAHFHEALYQKALELGVQVKLASRVENYDLDAPSVQLGSGETFKADLVVAFDGVKSVARRLVIGGKDVPPQLTGFAAYRATVDVEKMKCDPEVAWLLEKPSLNVWIGGGRHVMSYTIASGKSFNMVLSHMDHRDPTSWRSEDAIKDMKDNFKDWDPCLTKIIGMVDKTLKWPLLSSRPLQKWVAPTSKMLILGDAAHAMVPYMSQGAAMAIEDGAALAVVLSLIDSPAEMPNALKIFEKERIQRTSQMQGASLLNGKIWHFPDGREQILRDEAMRPEVEGKSFSWSPNQWSDPVTQWWAYAYDAEAAVEKAWTEANLGAKL